MKQLQVLLVEDDSLLRVGLKTLIDSREEYHVYADVGTGKDAIEMFHDRRSDIVLLDLHLPDIPGTQVLKQVKEIDLDVRVVILTAHDDNDYIYETLELGADAYVLKGANPDELFLGMRYAIDGDLFISPKLARFMVQSYLVVNRQRKSLPPLENLSPREREIVRLIINGKKSKSIADILFISPQTVDKHRSNILQKLGISSSSALIQNGTCILEVLDELSSQ